MLYYDNRKKVLQIILCKGSNINRGVIGERQIRLFSGQVNYQGI